MGNGLKKCKSCKAEFKQFNSLQNMCADCAIKKAKISVKKALVKVEKKRMDEMKERVKKLGDYKQDLQKVVNTIVRMIDQKNPCISCGTKIGQIQGGHYRAVGGWHNLRFNLFNIFCQCSTCNDPKRKGGNVIRYRDGLIFTFGQDIMNYIDDLNVIYPFIKLQKIDLQERIKIARSIIRELIELNKSDSLPRTPEQRIELRKIYNEKLKIYQ